VLCSLVLLLSGRRAAEAATLTVAAGGGGDYSTIAAAVAAAANGDAIRIVQSPHTEKGIAINANNRSLTIEGLGAELTVVQAAATPGTAGNRIFNITAKNVLIRFRDMTLQNGNPTNSGGGAILLSTDYGSSRNSTVEVQRCWFKNNIAAVASGTACGGAIQVSKSLLSIEASTFSDNAVTNTDGSATAGGGAVYASGADGFTVRNCTFSGNAIYAAQSWQYGGGVALYPTTWGRFDNCTLYSNRSLRLDGTPNATGGGGIRGTTGLVVESCLFVGNVANASYGSDAYAVQYTNCVYQGTFSASTDLGGSAKTNDARLDLVLANNGGPTPTHALLPGSAAIDKGSNPASLPFDQRGIGYKRVTGSGVDVGAFEFGSGLGGTLYLIR
jgi:hypothetical protein